uniref:class I SAM-dependent methyltransferase n=1 Tax=Pararhizobium sp. IMCC3301 TaxID=3067904 RepID=UPI002742508E|nr:class I SAM-dependent methyltransferase [Pararhizobium sp. IMCC3301]
MLFQPTTFWNLMARRYARSPIKNLEAYQHKLDMTARYLSPQDRLLEFGCGTGTTALIHAARVSHIDAIDFSSEMIAIAREKVVEQNVTNVRFEVAELEDWPIPEDGDGYDAVLAMSILHLVTDLDATLGRVYQALKPGGLLFSSTACIGSQSALLRSILPPLGAIGILPKILMLTPDMLTQAMTAQGLTVEHFWQPAKDAAAFVIARRPE